MPITQAMNNDFALLKRKAIHNAALSVYNKKKTCRRIPHNFIANVITDAKTNGIDIKRGDIYNHMYCHLMTNNDRIPSSSITPTNTSITDTASIESSTATRPETPTETPIVQNHGGRPKGSSKENKRIHAIAILAAKNKLVIVT